MEFLHILILISFGHPTYEDTWQSLMEAYSTLPVHQHTIADPLGVDY